MKKQFGLMIAVFAALALTVTSCKKDSDNPAPSNNTTQPPAKTKTQLITANNWKATSMISKGIDIFNFMSPCEKDNFTIIKADGTYMNDEGATKCDPSDPQVENGTWRFVNNETAFVLDGEDTSSILRLTADTLKVQTAFVDDEGVRNTVITTFVQKK